MQVGDDIGLGLGASKKKRKVSSTFRLKGRKSLGEFRDSNEPSVASVISVWGGVKS